ncbi:MAG: phosphoribosylformylglycinamidine synthase subunit PurQ [Alphaproteobacteria bacterium]|jgi:phosphoribosylformylglycinamidine synthase I
MKSAVIVFPGSNCDRDAAVALEQASGNAPSMVWHRDTEMPDVDLIVLPGGFSHGDYLRGGAIAARAPIMREVVRRGEQGTPIMGICNGFQILTEAGLLPGVLMRNAGLKFICRDVTVSVSDDTTVFTNQYAKDQVLRVPVANNEGNFFADEATLDRLEGDGRIAFRYADESGAVTAAANPNGSARNIAGIYNENRTILGLMPHPERAVDPRHCGTDGAGFFTSIVQALSA